MRNLPNYSQQAYFQYKSPILTEVKQILFKKFNTPPNM